MLSSGLASILPSSTRFATDKRHEVDGAHRAGEGRRAIGAPLTGGAAAAGFLSFVGPSRRGGARHRGRRHVDCVCDQHHADSALLAVFAAGRAEPVGYKALAPRQVLERHCIAVVVGTPWWRSAAAAPLLSAVRFQLINLRNPKVESISTFLDLRNDPISGN